MAKGKVSVRKMKSGEHHSLEQELWGVLAKLRMGKDLQSVLRDLLTPSEVVMLARRLRIARGLLAGKSFDRIRRDLGVGLATIAGVEHWLGKDEGRYRSLLRDLRC